jgi:shikimate kinase
MKNIVLIGYRGTGKSTIGRHLGTLLGWEFVDTDVLITARAGKTIREIFEGGGEAAFRALETAVIAELAQREGLVIAVGGGAILREENVAALKSNGQIWWLRAEAEILHARIQGDAVTNATRPNLTAAGGLAEVRELLARRTPLYEAAAHQTLEVGTVTPMQAAEQISTFIRAQ